MSQWSPQEYYCNFVCEKGCKQKRELIWNSESVFDAVFDMQEFIKDCEKTCSVLPARDACIVPDNF